MKTQINSVNGVMFGEPLVRISEQESNTTQALLRALLLAPLHDSIVKEVMWKLDL